MGLFQKVGNWVAKKLFQKKLEGIMAKLFGLLSGYKTYITLVLGIIVVVVGHFWGPLNLGGVDIPYVDTGEMWQAIWLAISGVFLRQGVSKSGPNA